MLLYVNFLVSIFDLELVHNIKKVLIPFLLPLNFFFLLSKFAFRSTGNLSQSHIILLNILLQNISSEPLIHDISNLRMLDLKI